MTPSRPVEPTYVPTARHAPAAGHVMGANAGSALPEASEGSGAAVAVQLPPARSRKKPLTVPPASVWPSATHEPEAGQLTSWISTSAPAGVPAGVGAAVADHAPPESESITPCSTPATDSKPTAVHVLASLHDTASICTSDDGPEGSGGALAVHAPPDSESRRPS